MEIAGRERAPATGDKLLVDRTKKLHRKPPFLVPSQILYVFDWDLFAEKTIFLVRLIVEDRVFASTALNAVYSGTAN